MFIQQVLYIHDCTVYIKNDLNIKSKYRLKQMLSKAYKDNESVGDAEFFLCV